jgi:hypothetical protein
MMSITDMTGMTSMNTTETQLAAAGVSWIDLAAFIVMGLLWIAVLAMLYGIYRIIRSKARGDTDWGDSPGL